MLLLAVVLLFDLSMRVATYVVGEVTKPSRLIKSGVGADRLVCFAPGLAVCGCVDASSVTTWMWRLPSAQTVHTVFKQALTLLGMVYQRFLFLNFTTVSSVSIAVIQRLVLEVCARVWVGTGTPAALTLPRYFLCVLRDADRHWPGLHDQALSIVPGGAEARACHAVREAGAGAAIRRVPPGCPA